MATRENRGISTILTTMIIVIASVMLGTAETLFGTSLFQTDTQQQSMSVSNTHLWFNSGSATPQVEGAMAVRNTGDKLLTIDTIKMRGTLMPVSTWVASPTTITVNAAAAQLEYMSSLTVPAFPPSPSAAYDLDGAGSAITTPITMTAQTISVSLDPGKTVIIYFTVPSSVITASDIGSAVTVTVTAGQIGLVQSVPVGSVNV